MRPNFKIRRANFLISAFMFSAVFSVWAQENKKDEIPPGMEMIEVKPGYRQLLPKGIKISKAGDLLKIEDLKDYLARRLQDMEDRFKQNEAAQAESKKEMDVRFAKIEAKDEELKKNIEGNVSKAESAGYDIKREIDSRIARIESAQEGLKKNIENRLTEVEPGLEEFRRELDELKRTVSEIQEALEAAAAKK
ncbi:MAG: hypothetical protein A3G37_02530 [Omnitrophica WOR_2 bacterium RIFCSPLOWO2_12_FULL_46_30]|nr:MAG: hypothetical protein A3G37_02530 [Omnitrophica WOR_2 bacterium RIFCSPLOWO2_12_FULL_46_30]